MDQSHARVTLNVMALNSLTTLMISTRTKTANLTYSTAMDVWFLACISFTALNMIEFAFAYRQHKNRLEATKMKKAKVARTIGIHKQITNARMERLYGFDVEKLMKKASDNV